MSVMDVLKHFQKSKKKNVAIFVDGPNILRKEININLDDVKKIAKKFGSIKIARVFLNQYAPNKLVEAVVNEGFEVIITIGDVDVSLAVDVTETIFDPHIDVLCVVSRDADFLPAIVKAKKYGKDTVVILAEEASAAALKNTADYVYILNK